MRILIGGALAALALMATGCTQSLSPYALRPIAENEAIVLVGVNSEIPFSEARHCEIVCVAWYPLGGRKEVMAFPMQVGSTFKLNAIYTMDNRVAPLKGSDLKIERPGVYYYGTIFGSHSQVAVRNTADPRLLLAAKRKYGSHFDKLEAVNFAWPDAANDRYLAFGYRDSEAVQVSLRAFSGKRLLLGKVAPAEHPDTNCRGGESLSLPDFLPYEEYIRRAFNQELQSAQLYDEGPEAVVLSGLMTELAFASVSDANWKMGLRIAAPDGRSAAASVTVPFNAVWSAATACPSAENAVPGTVQKLIESLVASPEFSALLTDASVSASK